MMANRIWRHHMGRGLVATPSNFGRLGEPPTHPELLDWLANELRRSGGSVKSLHRLIVTSAVYRQSSRATEEGQAREPDNRLLWRMEFIREQASGFADRVVREAGDDPRAQVERALAIALCREPDSSRVEDGAAFLEAQVRRLLEEGRSGEDARREALADLCHVLMNLSEFVYVE